MFISYIVECSMFRPLLSFLQSAHHWALEWDTCDSSREAVKILAPGVETHALVTSMLFLLLPLIQLGRQNQFIGSFSRRSRIYLALNGTRQLQTLSYISSLIRFFCLATFSPLLSNLLELASYTSGLDAPVPKGVSYASREILDLDILEGQHPDVALKAQNQRTPRKNNSLIRLRISWPLQNQLPLHLINVECMSF